MAPLLVKPVYMIRRDRFGRYQRQERWRQIIGYSILGGISLGIGLGIAGVGKPYTYIKEAEAATSTAEVKVMLVLDYSNPKDIEKLIRETFPESPNTAVAIAKAESEMNSKAFNPESHIGCNGSIGVFQIACVHNRKDPQALHDVETNIRKAREIYLREGWKPWGAFTDGRYKKYL